MNQHDDCTGCGRRTTHKSNLCQACRSITCKQCGRKYTRHTPGRTRCWECERGIKRTPVPQQNGGAV